MKKSDITKKIKEDILSRTPVWDEMQMLYMDTEVDLEYIAKACAATKYTLNELKEILFLEVFPSLRFNLYVLPGGEWRGFETSWLQQRILLKHTRGNFFQPFFLRGYTKEAWNSLKPLIEHQRTKAQ